MLRGGMLGPAIVVTRTGTGTGMLRACSYTAPASGHAGSTCHPYGAGTTIVPTTQVRILAPGVNNSPKATQLDRGRAGIKGMRVEAGRRRGARGPRAC